jgi:hypothetical protein
MKTLTTILLAIVISAGSAFAQPVKDKAVIPIGVTLNSVLRMNITSGGSIEFVFNTISDYTNGFNSGGGDETYRTYFNVASSSDFDVTIWSETANFIGSDAGGTMDLSHLEYRCIADPLASGADPANWTLAGITAITNTAAPLVTGTVGASAGNIAQNAFIIDWIVGVANPLLGDGYASDRYVLNVLLELTGK